MRMSLRNDIWKFDQRRVDNFPRERNATVFRTWGESNENLAFYALNGEHERCETHDSSFDLQIGVPGIRFLARTIKRVAKPLLPYFINLSDSMNRFREWVTCAFSAVIIHVTCSSSRWAKWRDKYNFRFDNVTRRRLIRCRDQMRKSVLEVAVIFIASHSRPSNKFVFV